MFLKYIFKNSQEFYEDNKLRKFSSEVNSMDSIPIEEEKKDEKMLRLEDIADNLSCNSLDISEYSTPCTTYKKQELQPIKILKTPVHDKIDFRLTPIYFD